MRITRLVAVSLVLCAAMPAYAQGEQEDLAGQIRELRQALDALRVQLADSRRDAEALRQEVQALRAQLESMPQADRLAVDQELLAAKVEDQEQTKVESGSKYHVRLSGLLLLNLVGTRGNVDNLDLPAIAEPRGAIDSGGSFGASVRQSSITLAVFGPTFGAAKVSGDLSVDFFGGFPTTNDGVSSPIIRLRTGKIALEWAKTSLIAGQDVPFFSPRSPTSLASTAYPALSSAGNLWTWTPQVAVEHRIALAPASTLIVQWGILDPFTGELPAREYTRMATAGERTGLPAVAMRVGWQRAAHEQVAAVAGGAYFSNQDWGLGRTVHAWAATTDWDVPLGPWLALSGELYRGQAIAGLGGGATASVLFDGSPIVATSAAVPVGSVGGWFQMKARPSSRIELNGAFGRDRASVAGAARLATPGLIDGPAISANASGFVNAIYQLRSNLLLSIEYRHLWTTTFDDVTRGAGHVSFSTGIGF